MIRILSSLKIQEQEQQAGARNDLFFLLLPTAPAPAIVVLA
jgi:hypothetical protein